jgi:aminoglycoside 6'-N-acetyltransferase
MIMQRPATPADIPLLQAWDEDPFVAASDPHGDWERETTLAVAGLDNLIAERDGRPIGLIQIADLERDASRYWRPAQPGFMAIDFWIGAEADRGQGHGRILMQQAIARCSADPAIHTAPIDPLQTNIEAIRFDERLGFRFMENRRFGKNDCAVRQLTRQEWETRHD